MGRVVSAGVLIFIIAAVGQDAHAQLVPQEAIAQGEGSADVSTEQDSAQNSDAAVVAAHETQPWHDEADEHVVHSSEEAAAAGDAGSDTPCVHGSPAGCPEPLRLLGEEARGFTINFAGFFRMQAGTFTPGRFFGVRTRDVDSANPYVGVNDGFALGAARLNMRAHFRDLYVRLTFDGAMSTYEHDLSPIGRYFTGLQDAYMGYNFAKYLQLYAGRFKPPYDMESLTAAFDQIFVHDALPSRGVSRHEGFAGDMPGFAPGRQIGIMATSDEALSLGAVDLGYGLAVTNGNSGRLTLNDNDLPAVWGRLTMGVKQDRSEKTDEEGPAGYAPGAGVLLGFSGFWNEVTTGLAPNLFNSRVVGAGVDLAVRLFIFDFRSQLLWTQTDHLLREGTESENALGGHAQLAVWVPNTGLLAAYRWGYYNPRWVVAGGSLADIADYDQVQHHTVGLRYSMTDYPVILWAEYTRSVEAPGRAIPNDRVEAAVQVTFQ